MRIKSGFLLLLSLLLLLATTIGVGYLYYQNHQDDIRSYVASFDSHANEVSDFLYENHDKFVRLSLTFPPSLSQKIAKQLYDKKSEIRFSAPDATQEREVVTYLIRMPDNGRREFLFDAKSGLLDGYFRTFKRQSEDGAALINLVPINATWLKEVDGVKKQS